MGDKYIILNDGKVKLSDVVNDCSNLCVPAAKGESLSSILNKICAKIKIGPSGAVVQEEVDPIFGASPAFEITYTDISHWNSAYNNQIISAAFAGTNLKTLTLTQQDGGTITADFTDLADQIVTITEGVGIDVAGSYPNFTITNTAPDQVVTLTEGSNVTITGTYPNFTISASGGAIGTDELAKVSANDTTAGYLNGKLVSGTGITLTENNNGGNETFTVAHSDTSSVLNLDTSGAQVIDTVTFDTFGHVQTITTRNLTLSDLGYTTPNAERFGFTGEDDVAGENRSFNLAGFNFTLTDVANRQFFIDRTAQTYFLGDVDDAGNGYKLEIGDFGTYAILGQTNGTGLGSIILMDSGLTLTSFQLGDNNGNYLLINVTGSPGATGPNTYQFGDIDSSLNGTQILLDDNTGTISWKESSLAGASNGFVWTLTNQTTGAGAWQAASTTYTDEMAQDAVFNAVVDGTGITTSYNDIANTFTITNSAPDQTVVLTEGSGVDISGTYPSFTITHEDTSSVSNLDTTGAQVIDTLTFDTFGHVTAVTTRNLTPSDIGVVDTNFANTDLSFTGQRTHTLTTAHKFELNVDGNNFLKYDPSNFYRFEYKALDVVNFANLILDPYSGFYLQVERTDITGNGGLIAANDTQTYLELAYPGGTTGLLNEYNGSIGYSLLADGNPYVGIYLDKTNGVKLGKGPALNDTNLGGIQIPITNELIFPAYPSTRNDGTTAKALYMSGATGNLFFGTISITSSGVSDFNEAAQDAVGGILTDSASIDLTYDDVANTITASVIDSYVRGLFSAGAGINYNSGTGAITNTDLGSSQFIFKNIAVSGQNTVVADSNNDTLTLVAGTNVTITTDDTTDSITINASGGVSSHSLLDSTVHTDTLTGTVVLGDIISGNSTPAWQRVAGNTTTTKKFLTQTGTGAVSALPTWGDVAAADVTAGAALTKTDDTNVTLTLGGSPTTALLAATSLTLGWTGQLSLARGGTGASLTDPGADRILFWDDSNSTVDWLTAGTGLSISGTTISNSAPDQTVVLNNGAGISVTGTYPTFTIASTITQYTDELAQDAVFGAVVDGTGITTNYDDVANTFTITNSDRGSSQNIFKNVAVSGQNTVVADSNNDTLTLVAGTNITITTDDTTDSITINATSGGADTNFAEDDLIFSGDRNHDLGIFELNLNNAGKFNVNLPGTGDTIGFINFASPQTLVLTTAEDYGAGWQYAEVVLESFGAAQNRTVMTSYNGGAGTFHRLTVQDDKIEATGLNGGSPDLDLFFVGLPTGGTSDDILTVDGSGQVVIRDASTLGGGSGTVNTGAALKAAYYPAAAATVDDWIGVEFNNTNLNTKIIQQATGDTALEIKGIAAQTGNYLTVSSSAATGDIFQVFSSGNSRFGTQTGAVTATPVLFSLGGTVADAAPTTAGDADKLKLKLFETAVSGQVCGIGISQPSSRNMDFYLDTDGGTYIWYVNGAYVFNVTKTRVQVSDLTSASSTNPPYLSMGLETSSVAGAHPRIRLNDTGNGTTSAGFGISSAQLDYMVATGNSHVWYVAGTEKMRVNATTLSTPNEVLINITDQGAYKLQVGGDTYFQGATSDGSTPLAQWHAANGGNRMYLWSDGHLRFGTNINSGTAVIQVNDIRPIVAYNSTSSQYSVIGVQNDLLSTSRSVEMVYTGSTYGSAFLTGGPTGEQGVLYTSGAYPLVLGTSNTMRAQITSGGQFQFTQAIRLPETTTPATPASGHGLLYFKSDGHVYALDDAGTETDLQAGGGGGFTNLTQFVSQTAHRLFYSDVNGDVQELAFGASDTYLQSSGTTSAPVWSVPKGPATYVVAANNSPAALKARADYICDGTADESEIQTALALGNVILVEGTYNISTTGIQMPSNRTLSGTGDATILLATSFATTDKMITNSGSTGIVIKDLKLNGASQTAGYGIFFSLVGTGTGATATTGATIDNVFVTDFFNTGIYFESCRHSLIHNVKATLINQFAINLVKKTAESQGCINVTVDKLDSLNSESAGVRISQSEHCNVTNSTFEGTSAFGSQNAVRCENSIRCLISTSNIRSMGEAGIYLSSSTYTSVIGNEIYGSGEDGINIEGSDYTLASGNNISFSGTYGIDLEGNYCAILNNEISSSSQDTDATYPNIETGSSDNIIAGNKFWRGTQTNKPSYALRFITASHRNMVEGNDCYEGGITGDIITTETTNKFRNNRGNSGAWKDLLYTDYELEMNTNKLLGRSTASQGKAEEITVGSGLSLSAGTLSATGGGGGITRTVVVTSGSITLGATALTDYMYFVAGAHTMSMPAAAGNTNRYTIKNNHSANITIDTAGAENIEGAASISIAPEESVDIISDGTNWFII